MAEGPARAPDRVAIAPDVVRAAIEWWLRVQADDAQRPACERWQRQHRDHALAWQRVTELDAQLDSGMAALPSSVPVSSAVERAASHLQRHRRVLKLLSLAAIGATAGWIGRDLAQDRGWLAGITTAVGERRRFTLDDGSVLALNTDSAVDLRFDAMQRLILLRRGEVGVTSGADAQSAQHRPLRVQTIHGEFEALGTRFTVHRHASATRLAVQQGRVAVRPTGSTQPLMAVRAGEAVRVGLRVEPIHERSLDFAAWDEGVLDVRDLPLADFLAEVARHRHGSLSCDPRVAALRVSGVFQLADPDALLAILPRMLPVEVESRTRWWVRVVPREQRSSPDV